MALLADFKASLTYPFKDPQWLGKLWPLPVIVAIPVLGLIGAFLLKGWRFEMVRYLANGRQDLPAFQFMLMLKRGMLLWATMLCYVLVPALVCSLLGIDGPLSMLFDAYHWVVGGSAQLAAPAPSEWLLLLSIYLIWDIIALPVFQAGMIRYAINGNWLSLFNVPMNFTVFFRYMLYFVKFYIFWLLLCLLILLADMALAMTGVGVLIIPAFSVVCYYVTTSHELGQLAQKIKKGQATNRSFEQLPGAAFEQLPAATRN